MLLMNYYKVVGACLCDNAASITDLAVTRPSGSTAAPYASTNKQGMEMFYYRNGNVSTDYDSYGIIFGTGTTPVSLSDYKLSGDIAVVTALNVTSTREITTSGVTVTVKCTLQNDTDADITIGEAGYIGNIYYSSSSAYRVLYDRTVLDEPVTIAAGGVGQVQFSVTLTYPTA